MEIDVLIPIATNTPYVEEAIKSVINQKGNFNIYLIENNVGSKEYTMSLKKIAKQYLCEYVFFEKRLPIFENWNRCLEVGKAEWVTFLHDDDVWSDDFLHQSSKLFSNYDAIFYSYEYFENSLKKKNFKKEFSIEDCNNREDLLIKVFGFYGHVSSFIFKRKLNIFFPEKFKMIGDQYAIRLAIAKNKEAKVAWLKTNSPNHIRQHPEQLTNKGASQFAANEKALTYRRFISSIQDEGLSLKSFGKKLTKSYKLDFLSRVFSATLFRRPVIWNLKLFFFILIKTKSFTLLFKTLFRLIFQNFIWYIKINVINSWVQK